METIVYAGNNVCSMRAWQHHESIAPHVRLERVVEDFQHRGHEDRQLYQFPDASCGGSIKGRLTALN